MPGPRSQPHPPGVPGREHVHTRPRQFHTFVPGTHRHRATRFPYTGDVRPNPLHGAWYAIPSEHSGHRTGPDLTYAAAYLTPPSSHGGLPRRPDGWAAPYAIFPPRSIVGPVIGVDHGKYSTAVLIQHHWLVVWGATEGRDVHGNLTHIRGQHYFLPTTEEHSRRLERVRLLDNTPAPGWCMPFGELWYLDAQLGLGHMIRLVGAGTPMAGPRHLLSGGAWLRLRSVTRFLQGLAGSRAPYVIAPSDLDTARAMLYPALDYPPFVHNPYSIPLPDVDLLSYVREDERCRAQVITFLRQWIARRRHRRRWRWAAFLTYHDILPDSIVGATNVLLLICSGL